MTLRCFVAMAFGRKDTDQVYDKLIAPTLRKHRVKAIRVDRIDHNDDIDKRIIAELSTCHFALADLTYARPSVYFEAGFAQRAVPVIYTCRGDHFASQAGDPNGNCRVHFDLQMKNIIAWQGLNDRSFAERLSRRITRVITPLLKSQEKAHAAEEAANQFLANSTEEKTRRILDICVSQLRGVGYFPVPEGAWKWRYKPEGYWDRINTKKHQIFTTLLDPEHSWLGIRSRDMSIRSSFVLVIPSVTKGVITNLKEFILAYPIYRTNAHNFRTTSPKELDEHIFVCSLHSASWSALMNNLPNFHRDPIRNELVWSGTQLIPTGLIATRGEIYISNNPRAEFVVRKGDHISELQLLGNKIQKKYGHKDLGRLKDVVRTIHVHLINCIQSESQFAEAMSDALRQSP